MPREIITAQHVANLGRRCLLFSLAIFWNRRWREWRLENPTRNEPQHVSSPIFISLHYCSSLPSFPSSQTSALVCFNRIPITMSDGRSTGRQDNLVSLCLRLLP